MGRKGFFHAGNGKKLQAKQNCVGFQGDKKIDPFQKQTSKRVLRHSVFFPRKVRRCGKNRLNTSTNIFSRQPKKQHLPRVKLSLFSKHPFGGFYR